MRCTNCGVTIPDNARFCSSCGLQVPSESVFEETVATTAQELPLLDESTNQAISVSQSEHMILNQDEAFRLFIGHNADYYLSKWSTSSDSTKRAGWNWAAFIGNVYWMGYRKMYLQALILTVFYIIASEFLFSNALTASIPIMLICGFLGNTVYYQYVNKKITSISSLYRELPTQREKIKEAGGTSWKGIGVVLIPVIVTALFLSNGYMKVDEQQVKSMVQFYEREGFRYQDGGETFFLFMKSPFGFSLALSGKDLSKIESANAYIPLGADANWIYTGAMIRGFFDDDRTVEQVKSWVSKQFQIFRSERYFPEPTKYIQNKYVKVLSVDPGTVMLIISSKETD